MTMKQLVPTITTWLAVISILFANPYRVLADEGKDGVHGLEVEVNGYHVTLSNESEWAKGENTIIVTLTDELGMPVTETDVQMLIAPKPAGHAEAGTEGHAEPEASTHGSESQSQDSMPGMDMGEPEASTHGSESQSHDSMPGMDMGEPGEEAAAHEEPAHGEEEHSNAIAMRAAEKHGMYIAETHLENSGEHEVLVMFHADGEMIEAGFTVEIPGTNAKTIVLWSFVMINMALIASAGFIKKQSILIKGAQ